MIIRRLTNSTYLLSSEFLGHIGLVFIRGDRYLFSGNNKVYSSFEEISQEINEPDIIWKSEIQRNNISIDGYPIKHSEYFNYKDGKYQSKKSSDILYYTGWWIINNSYISLSPKVSTINDACRGPFKDRFTANCELNRSKNDRTNS